MRNRLALLVLVLAFSATSCAAGPASEGLRPPPPHAKVLLIGIPGLNWEDIRDADAPALHSLIVSGSPANAALRVSNRLGEAYATIGSGRKVIADFSSGWAFNRGEVVETGTASDLFRRRGSVAEAGQVVVVSVEKIQSQNTARAFDARLGLLADRLAERGGAAGVVGNADPTLDSLPSRLPGGARMVLPEPDLPDPGIRREAALAAMRSDGTIDFGDVGRSLLERDPSAPYGVATSPDRFLDSFRRVWRRADFVVVETGDTTRANDYSLGLPEPRRRAMRREGLERADRLIAMLLEEVDLSRTLVMVLSPMNPGGQGVRAQLRPVVLAGSTLDPGVLTSASTNRPGLVTMADLSATIAHHLGLSNAEFEDGRVARVLPGSIDLDRLVDFNERAVVNDAIRLPVSAGALGMMLVIYLAALIWSRNAPLPAWLVYLLLTALSFPLASFVATLPVWRLGPQASMFAVAAAALAVAAAAAAAGTIRRGATSAATLIVAATFGFFLLDVAGGAPAQLDSVLGYSSVAGGRFFGLGNLGFAILAASGFLLAGTVADGIKNRRRFSLGRAGAVSLVVVAAIFTGHPLLGSDVGGTIAMVPAAVVFAYGLTERRVPHKAIPLLAVAAVVVVLAFASLDALRPAESRTHLGAFLIGLVQDPLTIWPFIRRKVTLAVNLAVGQGWGIAALGAAAALIYLQYRTGPSLGELVTRRPALGAALKGLLVAAIVASLVNDTGLGIAGLMLTIAAPWAMIMVAGQTAGPS